MITRVFNLETQQWTTYSLPAPRAVVAAYEQDRGNHNTWTYEHFPPYLEFAPGGRTVFAGKFGAIIAVR